MREKDYLVFLNFTARLAYYIMNKPSKLKPTLSVTMALSVDKMKK